ncbi:MAG: flagellin, partial [Selenomonadaceae bacterium]|nr:flagellin [Selenomonadaceae bacterium]
MAVRIANNNTSALILGELKKNNNKLSKDLKKVSSGLKTNDAGDGVADYSISEKMRALIRSLNQDIDNSKKGIDLVKVAEGGIQQIIEELRNMKKMALDSANDHNSEIDRAIIQKEFENRMKEIDDIATTTEYNRRILLDGRYWLKEYEDLIPIYESEYLKIISSNIENNTTLSVNIDTNVMHIPSSLEFVSSKLGVYKNNLDRKVLFTNANTNSVENLIFDPNEVMRYNSFQGLFPLAEGMYLQKTYPVQDGPI